MPDPDEADSLISRDLKSVDRGNEIRDRRLWDRSYLTLAAKTLMQPTVLVLLLAASIRMTGNIIEESFFLFQ